MKFKKLLDPLNNGFRENLKEIKINKTEVKEEHTIRCIRKESINKEPKENKKEINSKEPKENRKEINYKEPKENRKDINKK